jgi:hypothetical protein
MLTFLILLVLGLLVVYLARKIRRQRAVIKQLRRKLPKP